MKRSLGFVLFEAIVALIILSVFGLALVEQQSVALLETQLAMQDDQLVFDLESSLVIDQHSVAVIPIKVRSRWYHWPCQDLVAPCIYLMGAS